MKIYCCECEYMVEARLTTGKEIYPRRYDLRDIPFWKCDTCGNYVGCHYRSKESTRPLGYIPSREIKNARRHIHNILDPIWQSGKMPRRGVYNYISDRLGWVYHTAKIGSIDEARHVYKIVQDLSKELAND